MKNKFVSILLMLSPMLAFGSHEMTFVSTISNDRSSIEVTLQNHESYDLFCNELTLQSTYIHDNYNEKVASINLTKKNIYLPAGESVEFMVGEKETEFVRKKYNTAIIDSVKMLETSYCQKASFVNYCEYAAKDEEEMYTLNLIQQYARTNTCAVNEESLHTLNLQGQQVRSLKPLSYLESLERIDFSDNEITDVEPLAHLPKLWRVIVDNNPIKNLETLIAGNYVYYLSAEQVDFNSDNVKSLGRNLKTLKLGSNGLQSCKEWKKKFYQDRVSCL